MTEEDGASDVKTEVTESGDKPKDEKVEPEKK